jgi:DnaJ-domain-containing protein 1
MPTRSAAAKAKAPQPKKAEPVHAIPTDEASDSDDESTDDLSGEPDTSIDPYEVLDVLRDATEDQIKKAYRKLALRWHPGTLSICLTCPSLHTTKDGMADIIV